jgi:hypothetical protein
VETVGQNVSSYAGESLYLWRSDDQGSTLRPNGIRAIPEGTRIRRLTYSCGQPAPGLIPDGAAET